MPRITTARSGEERIGHLSAETGCPVETIRYYERIGLLPAPLRTEGGHRVYGPRQRERLSFILRARELGFSLEEIGELAGLAEGDQRACAAAEAIANRHIAAIRTRLADLKRMQAALQGLAEDCRRGHSADCPILESLAGRPGAETRRAARPSQ